ncbi:hypothetical protein ACTGJ9_013350 [Bradyrhizobium sp. RDM12]
MTNNDAATSERRIVLPPLPLICSGICCGKQNISPGSAKADPISPPNRCCKASIDGAIRNSSIERCSGSISIAHTLFNAFAVSDISMEVQRTICVT